MPLIPCFPCCVRVYKCVRACPLLCETAPASLALSACVWKHAGDYDMTSMLFYRAKQE